MHDLVVKVGEAITLPSRSIVVVKLIAMNGRWARLSIEDPDSGVSRQVESQRQLLEQRVPAGLGEAT